MKKIFVCSPYKGNHICPDIVDDDLDTFVNNYTNYIHAKQDHLKIARAMCRIIALHDNMPIAPHLFYTNFLDDDNPKERTIGCTLGLRQLKECDEVLVYEHCCGISKGMKVEIAVAHNNKIPILYLNEDGIKGSAK